MTNKSTAAIGIDLGTTFSVVARLDETGRPTTLVNSEGDLATPSVVLFDGSDVVVGKEALKALAVEEEHVAECAKRDMGRRLFHKAFNGNRYPPEVIQAWILKKLCADAASQIGPFDKVVITVPAYFDEVRRKATQDAGYMAGLEVLDIINEPTAAAVAFGFERGFLDHEGSRHTPQTILVYDLGGGTFDVTVMEIRGTDFVALATDGDVQLGGYDWDQRLISIVAEAFVAEHSQDPREDPASRGRLWRDCEDAKRTLSSRDKAAVACDCHGISSRIVVTRDQFEESTRDLLDRTRFTTTQALNAAGLTWGRIDRVLLVGGSTRMPMVRQMLAELSGKNPDTSVAADEAVAHGAALRAGLILAESRGERPSFQIQNVNSHGLGVVGNDPATGRRRNGIVIPCNTPIPVTAKRSFRTRRTGQGSVLVKIVEGENPSPDDCIPIGRCTVQGLPADLPAGSPVDVLFRYKPDGRLDVRVTVPDTPAKIQAVFTRENSISKSQLDGWRRYIGKSEPTEYF